MYKLFYLVLLGFNALLAIEIRGLCEDIPTIRDNLCAQGSTYLNEYAFVDYIFMDQNGRSLDEEFVRIREHHKSAWIHKDFILIHKTRVSNDGDRKVVFTQESNVMQDLLEKVPQDFYLACSFARRGWEYRLEKMRIYVEEVEGMAPSVEILGPLKPEVLSLFQKLGITTFLTQSLPSYLQSLKALNKS